MEGDGTEVDGTATRAVRLTPSQQRAIDHVTTTARSHQAEAIERSRRALAAAEVDTDVHDLAAALVQDRRVVLNFHPDRIAADGRTVVEGLLARGTYRSQFLTGISSGGLDPRPGGDRDRWEAVLFGDAYAHAAPQERPTYGGLDLFGDPDGPCPRFGSCHLRLRPAVPARATLCHGDSHLGPTDVGTAEVPHAVLAGLLEDAAAGMVCGRAISMADLVGIVLDRPPAGTGAPHGRALDDYVEAQVHGVVRLATDVEAVVADPSFDGTAIGADLQALADAHHLPLTWHAGFELDAADVPAHMRGPDVKALGARIAVWAATQTLHAELIGRAARSVATDPERWADHADPVTTLQHLKQLWHVLVRHGRPARHG